MALEFMGKTFAKVAEFQAEFPAYRGYVDLVRGGANTVEKMEAAIYARACKARSASLRGARNGPAYSINRKKPK